MIDYISGRIAELSPTQVVIDNHGIGYSIEISIQTYNALQGQESAKIYIHQHVSQKEEAIRQEYDKVEKEIEKLINDNLNMKSIKKYMNITLWC